jgi:hypothetical protein
LCAEHDRQLGGGSPLSSLLLAAISALLEKYDPDGQPFFDRE